MNIGPIPTARYLGPYTWFGARLRKLPNLDEIRCVTLDHNYRGKLDLVLKWLAGGMDWTDYGFRGVTA